MYIGIIGGGTAGLTAAIYGQRAGKRTLVIEGGAFGGQITTSPKVENYPGIASVSGSEFSTESAGSGDEAWDRAGERTCDGDFRRRRDQDHCND